MSTTTHPNETSPQAAVYYGMQPLSIQTLIAIASGQIDPVTTAKALLASQGLNLAGQWVGFDKAAALHGAPARQLNRFLIEQNQAAA